MMRINWTKKSITILIAFFVFAASPFFVSASEIPVADFASLESAVASASAGDSIIIEDDINFPRTLAINKSLTFKAADKPVTLTAASGHHMGTNGATTLLFDGRVVLDGNGSGGGIVNNGALTLENVVMQNCYNWGNSAGINSFGDLTVNNGVFTVNVSNNAGTADGGAIHCRGTAAARLTATISNSVFNGNSARYGGAIRADYSTVSVTGCEFSGNTAALQGACIYTADFTDLTVTGCTLTNNAGSGAILSNNSDLTFVDSEISNNTGRGIYGYSANRDINITVKGNSLINNNIMATGCGGGIMCYAWGSKATINVEDSSVISNNEATYGGGIANYTGSDVTINVSGNARIVGNTAYGEGGGIYGEKAVNIGVGTAVLSNNAKNGGGIYGAANADININGAEIAGNTAEQDGGGIWVNKLSNLTANGTTFSDNTASVGYVWDINDPVGSEQAADAVIHKSDIINTSYTRYFTNAYNNYDVNYASGEILSGIVLPGPPARGPAPPASGDVVGRVITGTPNAKAGITGGELFYEGLAKEEPPPVVTSEANPVTGRQNNIPEFFALLLLCAGTAYPAKSKKRR